MKQQKNTKTFLFRNKNTNIYQNIIIMEKRLEDKNYTKNQMVWAVGTSVIFGILLLMFIYFAIDGTFIPRIYNSGYMTLGDSIIIRAENSSSSTISMTFQGSFLPNDKIQQLATIETSSDFEDSYVRARIYVANSFGKKNILTAEFENDWEQMGDYYYYRRILSKDSSKAFLKSVTMPENSLEYESKKAYIINITIETIPYNSSVLSSTWDVNIDLIA